jgi:hypothetical protein
MNNKKETTTQYTQVNTWSANKARGTDIHPQLEGTSRAHKGASTQKCSHTFTSPFQTLSRQVHTCVLPHTKQATPCYNHALYE